MRVLGRSPAFTGVAVLTLGLGIGATTAIFSVVYAVLLKPLPFRDPERLVGVYHTGRATNQGRTTFLTYRDNQRVFEDIGAWDPKRVSITGRGEPEVIDAMLVTDRTLPLLRVQSMLGRVLSKEDDAPGSPQSMVLTYGYWRRAFGGAQDVVGQTLQVDGTPRTIVGVLPASFKFLRFDPAVLLPMQLDPAAAPGVSFGIQAVARLKPGVALAEANADVARMMPLLVERNAVFAKLELKPNVRPLAQDVIGDIGRTLWILLATVGVVLLIASANVANLFLVRAEGRQQELAVRTALGASRGRIACELLSESLMLARTREIGIRIALGAHAGDVRRLFLRHGFLLAGTGIGLGIAAAVALTRVMSTLLFGVGPTDPATYAAVSAVLTTVALLAAWLPARRVSRVDPTMALRSEI